MAITTTTTTASSPSVSDSDSEIDDVELVRKIQERFNLPSDSKTSEPVYMKPLKSLPPVGLSDNSDDDDDEDDFEMLRAIERRFASYMPRMQIVNDGIDEKNYTQKQLSAIQMVNLLLKYVPRSIFSELKTLAALEEMQTAGEGSRLDMAFPTVPALSNVEVIHAVPIDGLITTTSASSSLEAAAVLNYNVQKNLFKKDVTSNRFTLTKSSVEAHLLPLLQDAQNVELENLRPITLLLVDYDDGDHLTHEVELSKIGGGNYALTGVKRALTQKRDLKIGDVVGFRYDEVQLRLEFKLIQRR